MDVDKIRPLLLTAKRAGVRRSLYRVRRRLQLRFVDPLFAQYLYPLPPIKTLATNPSPQPQVEWCKQILSLHTASSAPPAWDRTAQSVVLLNQKPFPLRVPVQWHKPPMKDPLWTFQLHSWDWAWPGIQAAVDSDVPNSAVIDLWHDWLKHVPIGRGLAWEPYPTARRLLVWSLGWHITDQQPELAAAIAQQAAYLAHHFERDLDNNHLIVNAKALVWVGLLLPHLPQSQAWVRKGLNTFWQAFADQVRPDGGHVENSTSYHLSALLDGLETASLCSACDEAISTEHLHTLAKMRRFARALLTPDGQLPLLNDSIALDKAVTDAIFLLADRVLGEDEAKIEPESRIEVFEASGVACLRAGGEPDETYLLFDAGDLGPRHCPGHGHADTLSFELWRGAQPLIVDPGTYQYAAGEWRDYFRSTAAHSTATVDGQDQSTFVGPFRLGHLARGRFLGAAEKDGILEVSGEHDGYMRLPDPILHRRTIRLQGNEKISIEDSFSGKQQHEIVLRLHLAPCIVELLEPKTVSVIYPSGIQMLVQIDCAGGCCWRIEEGWNSKTWYQKERCPILACEMNVQLPLTCIMDLTLKT